jgi:acyl-coenzyme A thioesterase PaaI-like protein
MKNFQCFGCAPAHSFGLRLHFERDGNEVRSAFEPGRSYESYPGIVHGGISVAVLDEVMGNALALVAERLCFTVGLRTQFLHPLRSGESYVARTVIEPDDIAAPDGVARVRGEIGPACGGAFVAATGTYSWITLADARAVLGLTEDELTRYRRYFRDGSVPDGDK